MIQTLDGRYELLFIWLDHASDLADDKKLAFRAFIERDEAVIRSALSQIVTTQFPKGTVIDGFECGALLITVFQAMQYAFFEEEDPIGAPEALVGVVFGYLEKHPDHLTQLKDLLRKNLMDATAVSNYAKPSTRLSS